MNDIKVMSGSGRTNELLTAAISAAAGRLPRSPVFLCIGSDRLTGDCLGPIVGHMLTTRYNVPAFVYGTLELPVTAKNVVETEKQIRLRHARCKIIAIDAALGCAEDIGLIRVTKKGVVPGAASGKNLPRVGDISITAVVNAATADSSLLQTTRLGIVYRLAENIAEAIHGILSADSDLKSARLA